MLSESPQGRSESYDPAWYKQLASLEEGNFWFRSRNDLIEHFVGDTPLSGTSYLEIGCGTGFVLQRIRESLPHLTISATELHHEGLLYARDRVQKGARFMQMDAQSIPFREEFDIIGAFDVIEHIQADRTVLSEIHRALKPAGHLLLTVPQHKWLWSRYDEIACHARRYSGKELREKLTNAGFVIIRETSFNCFLIPVIYLSRIVSFHKKAESDVLDELRLSRLANFLLGGILRFEVYLTSRFRIDWPMGSSRIVLARKANPLSG